MKNIVLLLVAAFIGGCAVNDYTAMSKGSGIPDATLRQNCEDITCSYDKLKDRVQATASDMSMLYAMAGSESRTIEFTWISGENKVLVDVFSVSLFGGWPSVNYAEIYVGKKMVAKINGTVRRTLGAYNSSAREYEKIEMASGSISVNCAKKIAEAKPSEVTIRFYGNNGYHDKILPREHHLANVVKLAKGV